MQERKNHHLALCRRSRFFSFSVTPRIRSTLFLAVSSSIIFSRPAYTLDTVFYSQPSIRHTPVSATAWTAASSNRENQSTASPLDKLQSCWYAVHKISLFFCTSISDTVRKFPVSYRKCRCAFAVRKCLSFLRWRLLTGQIKRQISAPLHHRLFLILQSLSALFPASR